MKKFLLNLTLLFVIGIKVMSQSPDKDFVVVGDVSTDQNMLQIEMRYNRNINAYFIQNNEINAIEQIVDALKGKHYEDLHIYLRTAPNALIFNSTVISTKNIEQFTESLFVLKQSISGSIVIHSTIAFNSIDGIQLKQKLEKITGLKIIDVQ